MKTGVHIGVEKNAAAVSEAAAARPLFVGVLERRIDAAREVMEREWPAGRQWDEISEEAMGRYHRALRLAVRRVLLVREMMEGGAA